MRQKSNSVIITVPKGATCGLYPGMPESAKYFNAINPQNAVTCSETVCIEDHVDYIYRNLAVGVYHYGVSMEGHTAVCQIVNYTGEKAADGMWIPVELSPLSGDGYESGYIMLNTQEFINAQLASGEDVWGPEYTHLFRTPQFLREKDRPGVHQQTTNEELWSFIRNLEKTSESMYVFSLGKTPKYGFEMPLVLFTRENIAGMTLMQAAKVLRNNGKPTVQYTAQVHSNEPASSEGALAMMLELVSDHGKDLLDALDVYIIPRINLDGAVEVIRQSPTTGEDMNRDYLRMNNREICMVTGAYNLFLPEVAIDGHEKRTNFLTADGARCTDMELQVGAGSLNHPAMMTELAMEMALLAIQKGRTLGLRSHFYSNLASAAGGSAGSSYYGTRNSLSFLVETPGGTTLGRNCLERRIMGQYVLASTVLGYTAQHARKILDTVHGSRGRMAKLGNCYDERNVIVLEHGKAPTGSVPVPIIDVLTGDVTDPACDIAYHEHTVSLSFRPRPTAYLIPKGLEDETRILFVAKCHGITWYSIPENSVIKVQQYIKNEEAFSLTKEFSARFEKGAYVFPNTVPSTILSVIMEPDFNRSSGRKMTLYSMGLLSEQEGGAVPIYRYCHDLENGKIPQNP